MCRKVLTTASRLAPLATLGLALGLGLALASGLTLRLVEDQLAQIGHAHLPTTLGGRRHRGRRGRWRRGRSRRRGGRGRSTRRLLAATTTLLRATNQAT